MIPWIQVYSNLIKHPKIYALADELKLTSKDASPNAVAAGMVVSLWLWAAQNAPDGNLGQCTPRAIADAAEYRKKPEVFVDALVKVRFLDPDKKLHDWDEHASMLMDSIEASRENNAKRQQRYRDRKKQKKNAPGNADVTPASNGMRNVTDNGNNAPTKPNHTIPNHTVIKAGNNKDIGAGDSLNVTPASSEGRAFTLFWDAYPKKSTKQREEAWTAWKRLNPNPDGVAHIMAQLDAWKKSEQWLEQGGRFVTPAANFLDPEGEYLRKIPAQGKHSIPQGASGDMGAAELEAIQRVLQDGGRQYETILRTTEYPPDH